MTGRPERHDAAGKAGIELMQRIGSALVLAALALTLTYAGLWPFAALVAAGAGILAWEWKQLVRGRSADPAFYAHIAAVFIATLLTAAGNPAAGLAAIIGGGIGAAVLTADTSIRHWSALGPVYLGLPAVALVFLRSDSLYGVVAIVYLFIIVWSADTASYFFGKLIGGPKLVPRLSPGKTWSGAVAGLAVPALLGFVFALWITETRAFALALCGAALALASQVGDLAESAAKRTFHVKDAGGLVPGHGGLLDRVDGFLFAALAASTLAVWRDAASPGKALLIWP